jgi:hypothetical protein
VWSVTSQKALNEEESCGILGNVLGMCLAIARVTLCVCVTTNKGLWDQR